MREPSARRDVGGLACQAAGRGRGGARRARAPRAPCRASGSRRRPGRVRAAVTTTSGVRPDVVDPALVRGQPLGDRQLERAALAGQLLPLLDRALAERLSGRRASPARVSWSAPATISLADALPPSMRQTTWMRRVRGDAAGERVGRESGRPRRPAPRRSAPDADELAGDRRGPRSRSRPGCRAGRGSACVRPASTCAVSASRSSVAPRVGEAGQPDVADRARRRASWLIDLLLLDDVAGDRDDRTGRPSPRWTVSVDDRCPSGRGSCRGRSSTVRPSSEAPSIARTRSPAEQAGLLGRRAGDRRDDHAGGSPARACAQPCVPSAACVAISAPIPSNWPLIPCRLCAVLLRGEVRGVRVAERVDHPADRALDQRRRGRPSPPA